MLGPYLFSFPLTLFHERQPVIYVILSVKPKPDQSHVIHLALPSCFAVYCVLHTEYFMESVCVRYLRTSWSSRTLPMAYYVYYIHTAI